MLQRDGYQPMTTRLGNSGNNKIIGTDTGVVSIQRIDLGLDDAQSNGHSYGPLFTPDGSKVSFYSFASNLVPGDLNGTQDAFFADVSTGVVSRLAPTLYAGGTVTALPNNQQLGRRMAFSADGTKAAFVADDADGLTTGDSNQTIDVFWEDLTTGEVRLVSKGVAGAQSNGDNYYAEISADGTKVTWSGYANNLVGSDTNRTADIFVYDVVANTTKLVSTNAAGVQGNRGSALGVFSPDGTLLAFQSAASNLVTGDTNAHQDVFLKNLATGAVTLVSADVTGRSGTLDSTHALFSADGQWLVFQSDASLVAADTNLSTDVYGYNVLTGEKRLLSTDASGQAVASGDSTHGVLSNDGTKLAFQTAVAFSPADTNNNTDVYVKDLTTGALTLISQSLTGGSGSGNSNHPVFSPDGTSIAFASSASNLVAGDTNRLADIFLATLPGNGNDSLAGAAGNDSISGLSGNDSIDGGAGNDSMDGGTGTDTVVYASATAGVQVSLALTTAQVTGGAGTDTLVNFENLLGSDFNDTLGGNAGDNVLQGGAGNDSIDAGAGNDSVDGGTGIDTVTYANAAAAVQVSLALTTAQATGGAGTETLANVENLVGSGFNDTLGGNAGDNALQGGAGNDSIDGGAGNDAMDGGAGVDTASYASATAGVAVSLAVATAQATGGAGTDTLVNFEYLVGSDFNDTLTGSTGANLLQGGAGNDSIDGGAGNDSIDGGTGTDTLSYASATAGVRVNMSLTTAQVTGGAGTETLANFENLVGSDFNDSIVGTTGANLIRGGAGVDNINAGAGNDTVVGGSGADILTGGFGADVFMYEQLSDSGALLAGRDRIMDFSTAQGDKINLHLIDPALTVVTRFDNHAHQLMMSVQANNVTVMVDLNGDGVTDFSLMVSGVASLAASDFIL